MKELYFTAENIEGKAFEYLNNISIKQKTVFKPEKSALLVIDMQEFFLSDNSHAFIPSTKAIIPKIQSIIDVYEGNDLPVILTKHVNNSENAGLMGVWWKDVLTRENPLSQISKELVVGEPIIVEKSQYDSFYNSELEKVLRERGISQVVITGVMTHLCCETTTRSAFVRGFQSLFVVDGTAAYMEKFHISTLTNLSHGFCDLVTSKDVIKRIEQG